MVVQATNNHDAVVQAIRAARNSGRPAIIAYLTAGFPTKEKFAAHLRAVASVADVIEVGVPFSDPMADGPTIQMSSRVALEQGVTLQWIFDLLTSMKHEIKVPYLLMSYYNPLLAYGLNKLPKAAVEAGVAGMIVPDLPYEEGAEMLNAMNASNLALVQLVTPVTPPDRLAMLCNASRGFVYAVTKTGTTGSDVKIPDELLSYVDSVRKASPVPVCAGFGIRNREQVERLNNHVDGVIVGSALVEVLQRNEDAAAFLRGLKL
jgi:tryptophan synthase alpha chain